jgi:hypothetical protein
MVRHKRVPARPALPTSTEIQQSDHHSPALDDDLKRITRQHPQRDIPNVESLEPSEAPPKE